MEEEIQPLPETELKNKKNNDDNNNTIIIITILIILVIGVGGWYWYSNYYSNSSTNEVQSTSQSTEEPVPLSTVTSTKTFEEIENEIVFLDEDNSLLYTNVPYKYSIRYPKNWIINPNDPSAQNVSFSSITDKKNDVTVSVSVVEENTSYKTIEDWLKNKSEDGLENTEFVLNDEYNIMFSKTDNPENNLIIYHWICNGNVMSFSYQTSKSDFEDYQNYFEGILRTLTPCTE